MCLVLWFFTFTPPDTSRLGKIGRLGALSNYWVLYTKYTLRPKPKPIQLLPHQHHNWHLRGVVKNNNNKISKLDGIWNNSRRLKLSFSFVLTVQKCDIFMKKYRLLLFKQSSSLFSKNIHGRLYFRKIYFPLTFKQKQFKEKILKTSEILSLDKTQHYIGPWVFWMGH